MGNSPAAATRNALCQARDTMKHRTDPASEFSRIETALSASIERVSNGEVVDAGDIARDIEALCERLAATPGDSARGYADSLRALMESLTRLETVLQDKRHEFQQRIALLAPEPADNE